MPEVDNEMNMSLVEYEKKIAEKECELKKAKSDLEKLRAYAEEELRTVYGRLESQATAVEAARVYCREMRAAPIFRLIHLWSRIKLQLLKGSLAEKKAFFAWLFHRDEHVDSAYQPLCSIDNALAAAALEYAPMPALPIVVDNLPCIKDRKRLMESDFVKYTQDMAREYDSVFARPLSRNALKIRELIHTGSYKGVLIYPHTINWEPLQTPQQLLISFAEAGWLCLFCEHPAVLSGVKRVQENLYLVNEADVLQAVGNTEVTVLLTWMGSLSFVDRLNNKRIWYNILDQLDIFSLYDSFYLTAHNKIVDQVDWVSYVASPLTKYLNKNKANAIYLPNGCHAENLIKTGCGEVPEDMKEILGTGRPVVGYFGWISEWFDYDTLEYAAMQCPECSFVLIGPTNEENPVVAKGLHKLAKVPNVYLLGRKKYEDLPAYARRFTIATIPFQINEMMDCVSPIKYYEYCAYGLPTISSYMQEMERQECEFVACYRDKYEYVKLIKQYLNDDIIMKAKEKAPQIALDNTWKARVKTMETLFWSNKEL